MTVRVVIVAPILARNDAISRAAINNWRIIEALEGYSATLISGSNEYPEVRSTVVGEPFRLFEHPDFAAADVIIYHFGVFSTIFNYLLVGNGKAKQVVYFHNVTPARFLPAAAKPIIDRSIEQIYLFSEADAVWAASQTNVLALEALGLRHPAVTVCPLLVETPARSVLKDKPDQQVELLYLGRMVKSKGIIDLLDALDRLNPSELPPLRLRLAGNASFSDSGIIAEINVRAAASPHRIEFLGEVDDAARDRLLAEAHVLVIPSYHEGFCKPIVEALRAGCIPVGYAGYNIPHVAGDLGRLVPPGDIVALANAIAVVVDGIARSQRDTEARISLDNGLTRTVDLEALVDSHVAQFEWRAVSAKIAESLLKL
ncbi:glycosyltransferase family 4 protein [Acidimangrovimonas sediminis]|uniref:glycosyltransferase family 4 protein n=1 Tax=Acidimangrovimonas sediminis TaxID=2056283 RepID=UPI000C7FE6A6|nr:glycosyltransferase family 4 protein [Acidimangrovimonas sediminis]